MVSEGGRRYEGHEDSHGKIEHEKGARVARDRREAGEGEKHSESTSVCVARARTCDARRGATARRRQRRRQQCGYSESGALRLSPRAMPRATDGGRACSGALVCYTCAPFTLHATPRHTNMRNSLQVCWSNPSPPGPLPSPITLPRSHSLWVSLPAGTQIRALYTLSHTTTSQITAFRASKAVNARPPPSTICRASNARRFDCARGPDLESDGRCRRFQNQSRKHQHLRDQYVRILLKSAAQGLLLCACFCV